MLEPLIGRQSSNCGFSDTCEDELEKRNVETNLVRVDACHQTTYRLSYVIITVMGGGVA